MEIIDELIPLTEKDVELLKLRQFTSTIGCTIICFIAVAALSFIGFQFLSDSYLAIAIFGFVGLLLLLVGIGFIKAKKFENHAVTKDLEEGQKRRIVAPIEEKEVIDVTRRPPKWNIKKQIIYADQEIKLKYFMTVYGFKFPLTEEQYLAGARKGDFMEFTVAPNSKIILSEPEPLQKIR